LSRHRGKSVEGRIMSAELAIELDKQMRKQTVVSAS
jgi:hypothetical protein